MKAVINAIALGVRKHRFIDAQMSVDIVGGENWEAIEQQYLDRQTQDYERAQIATSVLYEVLRLMFPVAPDAELLTVTQGKVFLSDCGFSDELINRFYSGCEENDPWSVY